jgi:uncharacterized MnhB-related membrane protein
MNFTTHRIYLYTYYILFLLFSILMLAPKKILECLQTFASNAAILIYTIRKYGIMHFTVTNNFPVNVRFC